MIRVTSQVVGILALHYAWFGAILPCLWKDRGFPAILELFQVSNLKMNTFETNTQLPISTFALSASILHTIVVLCGVAVGARVRHIRVCACSKWVSGALRLVVGGCSVALLYNTLFYLFQQSFNEGWQYGFHYATQFFHPKGAIDFGHVAATSLSIEFATAFLIRVCTTHYVGVFPKFASKAIPRSLVSYVVCYFCFRYVLTPRVVRSLAATSGMLSMNNIADTGGVNLPHLNLDKWCGLAAAVHTLCIALGMVFHWLLLDVISSFTSPVCRNAIARHTNGILRFVVSFVAAVAFFTTLQMWLSYAGKHGVEFAERSTIVGAGGFFMSTTKDNTPSTASVAVAGGFQTLAFLLGAVLAEGFNILPPRCTRRCSTHVTACTSRNLRLRPAPPFVCALQPKDGDNENGPVNGVTEGLLLAGTAILLALYVADHHLLGVTVVKQLNALNLLLQDMPSWGPSLWHHLYDHYSRDQLFFMTLPILLISEIPLWFFTILDYMKLRWVDQYRIHYSKVESKRPRAYPTNVELWKAFKVHCINFFGIYCSVFIVGVGFACKTNIVPYSFSKELSKYWLYEFILCSFLSDVLFYVLHRAVHSKGLYQRLHKMHHEWIYTIALAHHYMDPLEATIFMLPPIIPPILMGSHITIVWCMVLFTQFGGIMGHSAFLLPIFGTSRYTTWIPFLNSQYHDLHHLRFNVNYGAVWPIVDMMFGTYREEPIIYIDGVADISVKKKKKQTTPSSSSLSPSKENTDDEKEEDEDEDDESIVHETAEGASKDEALPEIPWYIRPFAYAIGSSNIGATKKNT